jgi:hypothetical protein
LFLLRDPSREVAEAFRLGIQRALERAERDFVIVAHIDEDHIGIVQQLVPVLRRHVGSSHPRRIHTGHAQRHDLFFQTHLHAIERHFRRARFLVLEIRESRVAAQMLQQRMYGLRFPANRAVDPLLGQQNRSLDP